MKLWDAIKQKWNDLRDWWHETAPITRREYVSDVDLLFEQTASFRREAYDLATRVASLESAVVILARLSTPPQKPKAAKRKAKRHAR